MKGESQAGLVRIVAASYQDAIRQIGDRFGKDVSIVGTRKVRRPGMLGILGATGVEVYVTQKAKHEEFLEQRARASASAAKIADDSNKQEEMSGALDDLRAQVQLLLRMQPAAKSPAPPPRSAPARNLPVPDDDSPVLVPPREAVLAEARTLLAELGFSEETRAELLGRLGERKFSLLRTDPSETRTLARLGLSDLVRPKLPPCVPIGASTQQGGPIVVALVGPTGVGKTTTIAKLASLFQLVERRRVAFVTLDTYRIGAIDQLRKYSEILGVPLNVVADTMQLRTALEGLRNRDVVFIDTAGRSQRDAARLAEARDLLAGICAMEVHLCVSPSTSRETLIEVAKNFRIVPYNRLLITKLDESSRNGVLLDLFQTAKTPISYVTCGQEVPNDIHPASIERLEALLLGDA